MNKNQKKFKVGDKVTYTNPYGVIFTGKTITRIETFSEDGIFPGQTRYYYEPGDSPWFPVSADGLELAEVSR